MINARLRKISPAEPERPYHTGTVLPGVVHDGRCDQRVALQALLPIGLAHPSELPTPNIYTVLPAREVAPTPAAGPPSVASSQRELFHSWQCFEARRVPCVVIKRNGMGVS